MGSRAVVVIADNPQRGVAILSCLGTSLVRDCNLHKATHGHTLRRNVCGLSSKRDRGQCGDLPRLVHGDIRRTFRLVSLEVPRIYQD